MKSTLFTLFLCCVFSVQSQEAFHVVSEGAEWRIETTDILVRGVQEIAYIGDDEMGGELCQKLEVQSYTRWSSNMSWGPLITAQPSYLYIRKNGSDVEIYRNSTWNLLYKTQTYIGEVWHQGQTDTGEDVYVKVVQVDENTGNIETQACDENGVIHEPFTPEYNATYGPFWGVYNVGYISERMDLIEYFAKLNAIYCPVLNYSCFNNFPLVGQSCQSNFMTLGQEQFSQNEDFVLFPNPSNAGFQIDNSQEVLTITILDSKGKLVESFSEFSPLQFFDLTHLAPGIYAVLIQTNAAVKTILWTRTDL